MDKNKLSYFERELKRNKRTEYRFQACEALKPMIKEFMIIENDSRIEIETMPSTAITFNYILKGNISLKQEDGTSSDLPKAVAFGIARKPLQFTFSKNSLLLIVIFKCGQASSFIKQPINELYQQYLALDELFDPKKIYRLGKRLIEQNSFEEIVHSMEQFLIDEQGRVFSDINIKTAVQRIKEEKGLISIKSLIKELSVSRDVFEKRFRAKVGVTPKQYAKIIRFRNLLQKADFRDSLTEIGLDSGYYDQSHFIRDFKSFTGKLPSEFL